MRPAVPSIEMGPRHVSGETQVGNDGGATSSRNRRRCLGFGTMRNTNIHEAGGGRAVHWPRESRFSEAVCETDAQSITPKPHSSTGNGRPKYHDMGEENIAHAQITAVSRRLRIAGHCARPSRISTALIESCQHVTQSHGTKRKHSCIGERG